MVVRKVVERIAELCESKGLDQDQTQVSGPSGAATPDEPRIPLSESNIAVLGWRWLRLKAIAHSGLGDEVARASWIVFQFVSECLDVLT